MVRNGGSSAGSHLANPTSPIPSHCASIVVTSTLRVNIEMIALGDIQSKWSQRAEWSQKQRVLGLVLAAGHV